MDGAVDPAAAEKGSVGGVDDGVHRQLGNIPLPGFDSVAAIGVHLGLLWMPMPEHRKCFG
jgi:hypothetical protein